jgi:HEPN domain-containing protein
MIKARLISYGINPPRIHGLAALLDILSDYESIDEVLYDRASTLEDYAVGVRYPGHYGEPTISDAKEAYSIAINLSQTMMAGMKDLL